jgi:hypothetical protein
MLLVKNHKIQLKKISNPFVLSTYLVKVKVTLQQAVGTWGGGVEVQLYYFLKFGARWEWVVKATLRPL